MKSILFLFFLFPLYSIACSCDIPPVAIDFLQSKYVFWGQVIDKEYAKDSLSYTVTFKVEKDFKNDPKTPGTIKFTLRSEAKYFEYWTSCDYSINKGENWLIYASQSGIGYFCSNSRRYKSFDDIDAEQLSILKIANTIDIHKIIFTNIAISGIPMEKPKPVFALDSILSPLKAKGFKSTVGKLVINIDSNGNQTQVIDPWRSTLKGRDVYGVFFAEYVPNDNPPRSELQNDLLIYFKDLKWLPAKFMEQKVNSQIMLEIGFNKDGKIYIEYY